MNALADSPVVAPPDVQLLPAPRDSFPSEESLSNHAAISITAAAPLEQVYQRWLQYAEFPHFMRGKAGEDPEDNGRITWRIQIGELKSPWEAEATEELPMQRIAWESLNGRPSRNGGSVSFRAVGENRTQVTIAIEFRFSRFNPPAQYPLAPLASRLERCLMSFAEFVRGKPN